MARIIDLHPEEDGLVRVVSLKTVSGTYERSLSILICAHAPTEEKNDATKDAFYAELDRAYGRCPSHDINILLGDFIAKVGRKDIFGATVGRFSLHETTSSNGPD
ncbi:uncharacterized protein [Drosophila bipectinata]|uniref:uncharacterized protein n=1 Tax=Drosophila bipectinata TaxID=42026 RepID=UPI0038B2E991